MNTLNIPLFDLTMLLFGGASGTYIAALYGRKEILARIGTWICVAAAYFSSSWQNPSTPKLQPFPTRTNAQRPPRRPRHIVDHTQFASFSPTTFSKWERSLLTRVTPMLRAWAAIIMSIAPIGAPFFSSAARISP